MLLQPRKLPADPQTQHWHLDMYPKPARTGKLNKKKEAVKLWELTGGKLDKADDGRKIELSGGRWRDVELLAAELDERLGPWDGKNPRIITQEILDQLKESLGQLKD